MNFRIKRMLAAAIDIILLPILLGLIAGLVIVALNINQATRDNMLNYLNFLFSIIVWRDFVYSPGRHLLALDLIDSETKVRICCYRGNIIINLWKSFLRNLMLIIPFVLVIGYLIEMFIVLKKGYRLADKWAGTEVIAR